MTTPLKSCSKCQQQKPTTEFWKQADHADGLASACRSCMTDQKKAADTPERHQARKDWHAAWKRAVYRLIAGHKKEFRKLMAEERGR